MDVLRIALKMGARHDRLGCSLAIKASSAVVFSSSRSIEKAFYRLLDCFRLDISVCKCKKWYVRKDWTSDEAEGRGRVWVYDSYGIEPKRCISESDMRE